MTDHWLSEILHDSIIKDARLLYGRREPRDSSTS
jgi:hypothetical protein